MLVLAISMLLLGIALIVSRVLLSQVVSFCQVLFLAGNRLMSSMVFRGLQAIAEYCFEQLVTIYCQV